MIINGKTVATHAKFEALRNTKKLYTNQGEDTHTEYHRLYRGAHTCSRIINESVDNDKILFISGDSFWIPLMPILACYYKEVVLMDNRDCKSHKDYYEGRYFDEVIISFWEGNSIIKYLGENLK